MAYQHDQWKGDTGGTPWMQRTLIRWFRHTDLRIPYFCMGWMVPFYMLKNHCEYLASYHYFRRCWGHGPLKAFWNVYCQQFRFGQVIVDRFAMFAGKTFHIEVDRQELFDALESGDKGFVQLSCHMGNYELAGYSLTPKHKRFFALVFQGETETVMRQRQRMFETGRVTMVPVQEDLSHIFTLSGELENGNIVSMPGDRIFGSPRYVECELLGRKARLPLGPFALAAQREAPMLAVFVMKEGTTHYRIYVREVSDEAQTTGKEKANAMARTFAAHMGEMIRKYPHQWFNFYEFWD